MALLRSSGGALSGVMPRERALMAVVGMVEPVCRRSLRVELGGLRGGGVVSYGCILY